MSDPKHFWASGMRREVAQNYLLDLCGSESQNYTEIEAEVTCERCLASLRAGSLPSGAEAPGEAPSGPASTGPVFYPPGAGVAEQVRAAVVKEREELLEYVQALRSMNADPSYKTALRHVIEEIRRRL